MKKFHSGNYGTFLQAGMSAIITISILIASVIMLARSALFWLYFIQTRDYRFDRIVSAIKTRQFYRLIFSSHRLILIAFAFLLLPLLYSPITESEVGSRTFDLILYTLFTGFGILFAYFLFSVTHTCIALGRGALKIPKFTVKVTTLFLIVSILEVDVAVWFFIQHNLLRWFTGILILEIFQPLIVIGVFAFAYTPNIFIHRYFIARARKKIAAHKKITVIGITGSYGKTTTKEFLAHILSKKFKVLKTPAHINVDTGVARVILRTLKPEHEVFIVEMGAYRKGEIKKTCDLVKPTHGLITGLSDQHLELFGSLKAISEAKFELIAAVDEQSMIIANSDSKPLIIEFERRSIAPVWYGLSERAVLRARNPKLTADGLSFEINNTSFRGSVFGMACLNNLLGAITMAQNLGMSLDEIAKAVGTLAPVPHTMELKSAPSGALLIDDTYNANTDGVITALQDLQYTGRQKRVIVFSEVIELGDQAKEDHARIVEVILKHATHTMLLPSRLQKFMREKLVTSGYSASQFINTAAELKSLLSNDTVILFEGRDAQKLLNSL